MAGAREVLIQRWERLAKTAVGWDLSGVGKHDPGFGRRVVTAHVGCFSGQS